MWIPRTEDHIVALFLCFVGSYCISNSQSKGVSIFGEYIANRGERLGHSNSAWHASGVWQKLNWNFASGESIATESRWESNNGSTQYQEQELNYEICKESSSALLCSNAMSGYLPTPRLTTVHRSLVSRLTRLRLGNNFRRTPGPCI